MKGKRWPAVILVLVIAGSASACVRTAGAMVTSGIAHQERKGTMTPNDLKTYYLSDEFKELYIYDGNDLGAVCTPDGTQFKLWSPLAQSVQLNFYKDGYQSELDSSVQMEKGEKGVWVYQTKNILHGTYYDFNILLDDEISHTADPYARACGVNGLRSMVVDLNKTDPQGWEEDQAPAQGTEQIIYELHVKEFSWDESAGFPEDQRGKYTAFTKTDTTLNEDGIHPTGIPYLKELGVTHVQLMPVFDYASVDETGESSQFNWGYDPMNYNVPEGSYSTDPYHGEVRIREMKEMVKSLHQNGFRVIMDVVYNHTFSSDSWFQRTVPWYYYRINEDGTLSNGSGCGNDIASEREMSRKYILDSFLYWVEEYHIDGFRIDLMGLMDVELVNQIQRELDRIYGPGEKLIHGEPWTAGDTAMEEGFIPAVKEHVKELDQAVGIFCDNTRDAVKGHVFDAKKPGFVNGGSGFEQDILNSVSAWCTMGNSLEAKAPSQIITYVSSHDNLTLWDKLILTMQPDAGFHEMKVDVVKAHKLAAAIYFTCQGRLFLLSGEEFARTKEGLDNSYNAPISINRLDYQRAYENEALVSYYKGLIALRKQLPGLYDKSEHAKDRIFGQKIEGEGAVSFRVDNQGGSWDELYIAYNSNQSEIKLNLPEGNWNILANGESSTLWQSPEMVDGEIVLSPVSAIILGK